MSNIDPSGISVMEKFYIALFKSATEMVKDSVSTLLEGSVVNPAEVAKANGLGGNVDEMA